MCQLKLLFKEQMIDSWGKHNDTDVFYTSVSPTVNIIEKVKCEKQKKTLSKQFSHNLHRDNFLLVLMSAKTFEIQETTNWKVYEM